MDYSNQPFRFVNIGLNLRDSPDKVAEGFWTRLRNVRSNQEGQLQARSGFSLFLAPGGGEVHSLKRLDATTMIAGIGTNLYRNITVFPTGGYSGNPLSLVPYRPSLTSQNYMYVADSNQMRKVKSDGTDSKWGVTAPINPAAFAAGGVGNLNSSVAGASVYDYRYTYYSTTTGAESNPSPTANGINIVNQQGVVTVDASADPQVDQIRIYRRGGTITGTWRFSLAVINVSGTYNDNNADSSIAANEALAEDRDVPFTSVDSAGNTLKEVPLPYAWGPFAGKYIFACGDPNRPGFLYWTNAQQPDEAAVANNVEITSPSEALQNGFIYSSLPFVFSKDNLYAIDFGQATAIVPAPRKTACGKGLAAPWAFAIGDRIYFLANDGIYATDGGQEQRLSEPIRSIFRGIALEDFAPVDYDQQTELRLEYHESEIWFFYKDTNGVKRWIIYDLLYDRWRTRGDSTLTEFNMAYSDENVSVSNLLIGGANGSIYQLDRNKVDDAGASYEVNARTGSLDLGLPTTLKEFGDLILDIDTGGTSIEITPYLNAETTALPTQVITGAAGRRKYVISLADTFAYSLAIDMFFESETDVMPIVYAMEILWHADQEVLRHWEYPPTTNGLSGWQHIRDGYLTVRSDGELTFTVGIDGVTYTPNFKNGSNTGGLKQKVYFEVPPAKGKVFKYEINSTADFRIYGDECEIRAKAWNTQIGYQLVTPFAGGDT